MNAALYLVIAFALTPLAFGLLLALTARLARSNAERERVILALLRDASLSGDALVKRSGGRLSRGTVYVVLQSMEERGFVMVCGRSAIAERRCCRLTDKGRATVTT